MKTYSRLNNIKIGNFQSNTSIKKELIVNNFHSLLNNQTKSTNFESTEKQSAKLISRLDTKQYSRSRMIPIRPQATTKSVDNLGYISLVNALK